MDRSGNAIAGTSHHPDLAELVTKPAPFLTVWAADATFQRELTTAQRDLPLDPGVVQRLVTRLHEGLRGAGGVVGVAAGDGTILIEALPEAPRRQLVRGAALPSLSPVLEHRQGTIGFCSVLIDRRGADLHWSTPAGSGSRTVEGDADAMVHKFKDSDSGAGFGSGYRQHDFQRKVEANWERLATEVGRALGDVTAMVRPRVIPAGGDVRMVQLLRERLPSEVARLLRDVPGSRSSDGAEDLREEATRRWLRTAAAEDTVEALRVFERERGQHDRAAEGPDATFAALREARVDVLLVHDDPDDQRLAWFLDGQPAVASPDRTGITGMGEDPRSARMVDVAIRAALVTSAGLRIVPATPLPDGLGAILRW